MRKALFLLITHGAMLGAGFVLGVYALPILVAPPVPDAAMLEEKAQGARFSTTLRRDLPGSDFLHWGEGTVSLSDTQVVHRGRLAPGPDYRLYLVPGTVEDKAAFEAVKDQSLRVGRVDGFDGFVLDLPVGTNPEDYDSVVIWCETFAAFITAGRYR